MALVYAHTCTCCTFRGVKDSADWAGRPPICAHIQFPLQEVPPAYASACSALSPSGWKDVFLCLCNGNSPWTPCHKTKDKAYGRSIHAMPVLGAQAVLVLSQPVPRQPGLFYLLVLTLVVMSFSFASSLSSQVCPWRWSLCGVLALSMASVWPCSHVMAVNLLPTTRVLQATQTSVSSLSCPPCSVHVPHALLHALPPQDQSKMAPTWEETAHERSSREHLCPSISEPQKKRHQLLGTALVFFPWFSFTLRCKNCSQKYMSLADDLGGSEEGGAQLWPLRIFLSSFLCGQPTAWLVLSKRDRRDPSRDPGLPDLCRIKGSLSRPGLTQILLVI